MTKIFSPIYIFLSWFDGRSTRFIVLFFRRFLLVIKRFLSCFFSDELTDRQNCLMSSLIISSEYSHQSPTNIEICPSKNDQVRVRLIPSVYLVSLDILPVSIEWTFMILDNDVKCCWISFISSCSLHDLIHWFKYSRASYDFVRFNLPSLRFFCSIFYKIKSWMKQWNPSVPFDTLTDEG